jgi:hypothetical protein
MWSMAHIQVDHPVVSLCPDYGHIAFGDNMLNPHQKIFGRQAYQDFDPRIIPGARLPLVPFIHGRNKCWQQSVREHMCRIVYGQFRRQWWSVIFIKHGSTEKTDKPWPVCGFVIVAGNMKSQPRVTSFHVFFEGFTLRLIMWKIINHYQLLVVFDLCIIQVIHIARGIKYKAVAYCQLFEELNGVISLFQVPE